LVSGKEIVSQTADGGGKIRMIRGRHVENGVEESGIEAGPAFTRTEALVAIISACGEAKAANHWGAMAMISLPFVFSGERE